MSDQSKAIKLRLRPHHIFCLPFLTFDSNLDPRFLQVLTKMKRTLISEPDRMVTAIEGVDEICQACPSRIGDQCRSTFIKEEMVRRLDALLLRDVQKSYGETLKVGQWQSAIHQKWPYRLCRVCRWRTYCSPQVT